MHEARQASRQPFPRGVVFHFSLADLTLSDEQTRDFFEIASGYGPPPSAERLGLALVADHRILSVFRAEVRLVKQTATTRKLRLSLVESVWICFHMLSISREWNPGAFPRSEFRHKPVIRRPGPIQCVATVY